MINLGSVLKYLRETKPETVWIVGSGWEGSYSLEDTTCAGAIAANLEDEADFGNDEAVAAATLYKAWKGEVEELFYQASHGKRLLKLDCAEDIAYCAKLDVVDVLPKQSSAGLLVAA
jgi:2-phosphosulfolactate phosphatase